MPRLPARILLPLLLLAGCSPHPATGTWSGAAPESGRFQRLEVTYEGRALLYAAGEDKAGRHCFWSGESAQSIALSCTPAFNPELEEHYRLVIGADGRASLRQGDKVLAQWERQVQ
ncbi:hypothetical protein [Sulfurivermis fontis]|jgi:hypothetical protein|uniref:hypothetical protein n=1 Tax=Sulfurivermis fontis TaxID=1972068 RepID=UPI000FD920BB|nr:hypothetical protein [Sulfurivermis fontis]